MMGTLSQNFFNRSTLVVAEELLGKFLVKQEGFERISLMIIEVEAYDGPLDLACHASKGQTLRNSVMFGPAGYFYVYFVYGMYWMLNVVTGPEKYPAAVLIRGAGQYNGPGKLTRALHIDKSFQGKLATPETGLWFEDRGIVLHSPIQKTARIGIDYAGKVWSQKPYRFVIQDSISY